MEKTRVKKGEKYWHILIFSGLIEVEWLIEENLSEDESNFKMGNYFHTKKEAESMAKKLKAVLKDAEVIEMPSEEEIKVASYHCTDGYDDDQIPGFREGVNWLKSKIVK